MSDSKKSENKPLTFGPNSWLIEEMYQNYLQDPNSVGESWRDFFADYKSGGAAAIPSAPVAPPPPQAAEEPAAVTPAPAENGAALPEGALPIRGPAALIVKNMTQSLKIPTATSTRIIPVKLLDENRRIINEFQLSVGGSKVSFTHIIAWGILKALMKMPAMTAHYVESKGKPYKVVPEHINFGLAVDVEKKDGSRSLLVPNIKAADTLSFQEFFDAYNALIRKVRTNAIDPTDFQGTTVTLTNPGMIGTVHSIPRLMQGQGLIVATGGIQYPAEWHSADPNAIARLGLSKVMTVTSTYDHRIIQGAESGLFLQTLHKLLAGEDDFYEDIFASMQIPHHPLKLTRDSNAFFDAAAGGAASEAEKQVRVARLINMYRVRGHLIANTNTLSFEARSHPELEPENYGLTIWDYDREFFTFDLTGRRRATLREILDILQEAYCRTIGVEFMHIQEPEQKRWIQERVEGVHRSEWLSKGQIRRILLKLNDAEAFERFLHTKYIGHKRFSLEGAETLIPMLDHLFTSAAQSGVREVIIGMAHRGRLNVLANNLGKSYARIFREFEGDLDPESQQGTGDVKYHLGAQGTHVTEDGHELALELASNPSHLEAVDPVVEGMARARQDVEQDEQGEQIMPVLIHGDAAFAGQGVVAETLNLSQLEGYATGGTVHIVVNNIIGFTTSPAKARSTVYATDVAKMVQAPIFHVNGDDPEACLRVVELAFKFRQAFKKDVVVDMMCYRRHGHNEGDEPSYTQPLMYKKIDEKRSVRKLYTEALIRRGDLTMEEAEKAMDEFHAKLQKAFEETRDSKPPEVVIPYMDTEPEPLPEVDTRVQRATLEEITAALSTLPEGFHGHPKLGRWLQARSKMLENDSVDWSLAEALAFGSLLLEGIPVRLAGQDSGRGTFSHRHSVLVDYENEDKYIPLNHIREQEQAQYQVHDSLLSEYAALGFEYGYSVSRQEALVLWEAQFGDFVNGAQIVIDQFISSAENKWNQKSRLTLLLPHGFEGQGPEHSSARLERFLTLCAENNMIVTFPTTAAQYFHLLRRQGKLEMLKPLIVMTPKSLLRAAVTKCPVASFTDGQFQQLLDDPKQPRKATRLLLCTGKVAFDLMKYRDENGIEDVAVARLEQLYPFPYEQVKKLFEIYPDAREVRWVQEEPRNMGAWYFVLPRMREILPQTHTFDYVSRYSSGSPATGSMHVHLAEQKLLVERAFSRG